MVATSHRVLFLDDDELLRGTFSRALRSFGFSVEAFACAQAAMEALRHNTYDLLLLDRRMPDGDGLDLCRDLRQRGHAGPIVCFTQYDTEDDELAALEAGADALISKSVGTKLLVERLRACLRRSSQPARHQSGNMLCSPELEICYESVPKLLAAGSVVELTRIEERLFACLHASVRSVVGLEALRQSAWPNQVVLLNTVHKHISSLRGKLLGTGWTIENERGAGYRLRDEPDRAGRRASS